MTDRNAEMSPMPTTKLPKKNDTIEVRLSEEAKTAFMERCRRQGRSASETIRAFIDGQAASPSVFGNRRMSCWRMAAAGALGALLGLGVAAPSLARPARDTRPAFDRLDRNHDGLLTYQEFSAR